MDVADDSHPEYFSWVLLSSSPTPNCLFGACYKQEEIHESKLPLWGSRIP